MGCGKNYTAICLLKYYRHLCSRRRGHTGIHHIYAAGNESAANKLLHHLARETSVSAYHYLVTLLSWPSSLKLRSIGCSVLYYVYRSESISNCTPYGAPDSGNRFDKCHNIPFYYGAKLK